MKIKFNYLIVLLSLLAFSCVREYDGPPLLEPKYEKDANITIAGLKEKYKDISDVTIIEYEFIVNARVTGNDESGNIYKQLYIEDETGGISIGIDQNSVYASLRVGQEIYLELHNLYILKYGGELQIGYGDTNANRIPWNIFLAHIHLQGFPNAEKAQPTPVTINKLTDAHVHTLVRFDNVSFQNAGNGATFVIGDATTEQPIVDANGTTLVVRTSAYASFGAELVPEGTGSVVGVLGRYNGTWQLTIRDMNDLIDFAPGSSGGGNEGGGNEGGDGETFFTETFGTLDVSSSTLRKKIAEYTGYSNTNVTYSDPSGLSDIRSTNAFDNHVWLPATGDSYLVISRLNTSVYTSCTLSFNIIPNMYDLNDSDVVDIADMLTLSWNGTAYTVPSTSVMKSEQNSYKTITIENLPTASDTVIEFMAKSATNLGLRLDNIKISGIKEGE